MLFDNNIEIFSSRDKIRDQMIEFAKSELSLENFDFNKTSFLSYIINILSVLSANHIYHNSNVWKQFFLVSADQKESVLNISAMLGYEPNFAQPSYSTVLMTIPLDFIVDSNNITFKLYGSTNLENKIAFRFYAKDVIFSLLNSIEVTVTKTTSTTYSAVVKEIYTKGDIISSSDIFGLLPYEILTTDNGKSLRFLVKVAQLYKLTGDQTSFNIPALKPYEFYIKDIDFNSGQISNVEIITVNQKLKTLLTTGNINTTIQPRIWERYSNIPLIPENKYGYVIRNTSRGIRIYFGNGLYGRQPVEGDECDITLHLTDGSSGNVVSGTIIKSDSFSVLDNTKLKQITPDIVNPEPSYGGMDNPTIDEIKSNAIIHVKSGSRLVTKDDYDSFGKIAVDLPVSTTVHVLKRSDLKRNEICLFTDLIYNNTVDNSSYVVPTRNALWDLDTTSGSVYTIRNDDTITIDSENYTSLFNIQIYPDILSTRYYYTADDVEYPVVISRSQTSDTKIVPTYAKFYVDKADNPSNDKSYFELYYNKVIEGDLPTLSCQVEVPWSGKSYDMPHSVSSSKFYLDFEDYITIQEITEGEQQYKFTIYDTSGSTPTIINICYVNATAVKDLDEFMYSQVRYATDSTENYLIYDVPVIKTDYYDRIDQSKFNYYVLNKIVNFDPTKYRMLTDFINLKFANTTGEMHNMQLNPVDRDPVININVEEEPLFPVQGDRYAISNDDNPWNREGGFIATASDYTPSGWLFETLKVNDMFYVVNLGKYRVYNGSEFIEPVQNIPIDIKIVAWMDSSYSGSDAGLIEKIKNTLVDTLYSNFGYNKTLLISEITRIVKEIDGVSNCKVLKPEIDIQFKYEVEDLSEDELLTYTPELTYFDTNSIEVELRVQ